MVKKNSPVIYKNQPAVVSEIDGDKFTVQFFSTTSKGKKEIATQKVREKDIVLLHDGGATSLDALAYFSDANFETQILEVYELVISDEQMANRFIAFSELAELMRGEFLPDESWALFNFLNTSFEFELNLDSLKKGEIFFKARVAEEISILKNKAYAKEHEAEAKDAFVKRLREKKLDLPNDSIFVSEIESLALGKSQKSRLMSMAGFSETAERAHKLLLETGVWDETKNPFPYRHGFSLQSAREKLLSPPEEERLEIKEIAYAIDSEWSADPDDAVSYDGKYLWVHIADPASSVLPDSNIDKAARERGTTLYLPEATVRMLAENSLADYALGLSEKSFALSFRLELDDEANILECLIFKTVVHVKRLTYKEADAIKENSELKIFFDIAQKNAAKRKAHGACSINLPEIDIRVEPETKKVFIENDVRYESCDMVQEMMLLAGEGAARFAFKNKIPFPYVSQEEPDIPKDLPSGLAGEFRLLRCMHKRSVGIVPSPHAGIGVTFYSQVTSPLRRYGDLVAHQQLRAFLDDKPLIDKDEMLLRISAGDAASIAARKASRESELHWKLVYLLQNPEWSAEAICVDVQKGKVPQFFIPSLAMQTFIEGNFSLNDTVKVRASKIDIVTQNVIFVLC